MIIVSPAVSQLGRHNPSVLNCRDAVATIVPDNLAFLPKQVFNIHFNFILKVCGFGIKS